MLENILDPVWAFISMERPYIAFEMEISDRETERDRQMDRNYRDKRKRKIRPTELMATKTRY